MATTTDSLKQKLARVVEDVLREHLAQCEAAAVAAVHAGFRRASAGSARPSKRTKRAPRSSPSRRRTPDEIEALSERLYEAICRHPGETMSVFAGAVGVTANELRRPSTVLRREGRVRTVGKRYGTRYFPMDE